MVSTATSRRLLSETRRSVCTALAPANRGWAFWEAASATSRLGIRVFMPTQPPPMWIISQVKAVRRLGLSLGLSITRRSGLQAA